MSRRPPPPVLPLEQLERELGRWPAGAASDPADPFDPRTSDCREQDDNEEAWEEKEVLLFAPPPPPCCCPPLQQQLLL